MNKDKIIRAFKLIDTKTEVILRREVMEADCHNFSELSDKMATYIQTICKQMIKELNNEK